MKISRELGQDWQDLLASEYIDPRELKASSPIRDFVVVHLQELRDKGRSDRTVPRYAAYLADFVRFMEGDGKRAKARVSDIDIRSLKAYGSHLTRRGVQNGRYGGRATISAATKNLHLIALRGLLKFGVLLDLAVPGPEKVELAKAVQPSPDARHLAEDRVERLLKACDTATEKGIRARALLEFLLATGCRISEAVGLDRRQLELAKGARAPDDELELPHAFRADELELTHAFRADELQLTHAFGNEHVRQIGEIAGNGESGACSTHIHCATRNVRQVPPRFRQP